MPTGTSKNGKPQRHPDRRIRKTRERLGAAIIQLMVEKPMDEITVQEVLQRAGVGRSTFYLHFRDKDDLFMSEIEQALENWSTALVRRQEKSRRVVPVAEVFAHIAEAQKLYRAMVESGRIDDFFSLAQEYFARGIEQRLKALMRAGKIPEKGLRARSQALAGSLLALLKWWLEHGAKESAREIDDLFHSIVWDGLPSAAAVKD
jgi:AcrR family transcriptional regulator